MVLVKMLMEIDPLSMREFLVMMMISPSGREVPPAESLHRRAKVLLPKFCLETAALRPESFLLIFSWAKDTLYQKMGIGGLPGGPRGRGRAQGGRARPPPLWIVGGPLWCFFAQYF